MVEFRSIYVNDEPWDGTQFHKTPTLFWGSDMPPARTRTKQDHSVNDDSLEATTIIIVDVREVEQLTITPDLSVRDELLPIT